MAPNDKFEEVQVDQGEKKLLSCKSCHRTFVSIIFLNI